MGTPTTPALLTYDRDLELLRALVAEFGEDYVYARHDDLVTCLYVHGDQPGCGVGHVLRRAGVPLDVLRAADAAKNSSVLNVVEFRAYASPEALRLLAEFQNVQDAGDPWGEALRYALAATGGGSDE